MTYTDITKLENCPECGANWVNLTQEEVNDLRNKKFELTEYGKEKLRKLMNKPIEAKVSEEDFNKIVDAFNNPQPYPDAMFEEAEKREKLNAGFKQDEDGNWYRPTLQELTRNERITLAEKEIAYIVMGGQDGREYANSIAFILQVLDSLRDD
jgi:DNA-binding PadR family transcriptional regulator